MSKKRSLLDYKDQHGYLVTSQKDGGDSAFFTGHEYLGKFIKAINLAYVAGLRMKFQGLLKRLETGPGNYCRHPDKSRWYSDSDRMSRDQMTPLIITMGAFGLKEELHASKKAWLKRGMFMTNTRRNGATEVNHGELKGNGPDRRNYNWKLPDFAPGFIGLYIRAFHSKRWSYVLWLTDLELLLGALSSKVFGAHYDQHNFIARLWQAQTFLPTALSRQALRIYKSIRPYKRPSIVDYEAKNPIQTHIQWYASRGDYKYPPLDLLWNPVIEDWYK